LPAVRLGRMLARGICSMSASPSLPVFALPQRLVRASWAAVGLFTLMSLIGATSAPLLLVKAPLLLVMLAPDGRHVALTAGQIEPLLLCSVSVIRRSLYSVGVYGLGRAYGDVSVSWVEARARRLGRVLRVLERLFERFGPAVLIVAPFPALCVVAGAARTRLAVFLPALLLGHCVWTGTTVWLGARFADSSQLVIDFFAQRLLESTLVCVALVAAYQYFSRRRRTPDPSE